MKRLLFSDCTKSLVLDKKTSFSRLAKSENPQFTCVNEEFSDKRNAEPLAREHKLEKLLCEQNGVFLPTLFILLVAVICFSCEKWEKTDGVSIASHFPQFELIGGEFQSYVKGELEEWEEPGYKAFVEGKEVEADDFGDEVNTDSVGAYFRYYTASNAQRIQSSTIRTIAITHKEVSQTDLSGVYITSQFGQMVRMRVVKNDEKGYYECEDILGFPGAEMPGNFADLGLGQLQLVPGEGDFGSYATTRGTHTPNTLTFEVEFEEEPNTGLIVTVTWFREDN